MPQAMRRTRPRIYANVESVLFAHLINCRVSNVTITVTLVVQVGSLTTMIVVLAHRSAYLALVPYSAFLYVLPDSSVVAAL